MLQEVFSVLLDRSVMVVMTILAVLVIRAILWKAPKKYAYVLWLLVGIRLVWPDLTGMSSEFSMYRVTQLPRTQVQESAVLRPGMEAHGQAQTAGPSSKMTSGTSQEMGKKMGKTGATDSESADSLTGIRRIASYVWIVGMSVLLLWNVMQYIRMKQRVAAAIRFRDNIYECDRIFTPFVLGLVAPKIYIPFHMKEQEREYVCAHEQYHIRRGDPVIQVIAFLICLIYWFHPLVWLSYLLMVRDMEMSCDEYVLDHAGRDIREVYSNLLFGFAVRSGNRGMGVLAFGECDVRKRVKHVMRFRRHGKWIGILAAVLVVAAGIFCLTDIREEKGNQNKMMAKIPAVDLNETQGADGTRLYYADDDTIVFGGCYGLFVYDTMKHRFERAVDLREIGCDATQGDDACFVSVKQDGSEVYLRKVSDTEGIYVYHVRDNSLTRRSSEPKKEELFDGVGEDWASAEFTGTGDGSLKTVQLKNNWDVIGKLGYRYSDPEGAADPAGKDEEYLLFLSDDYMNQDSSGKSTEYSADAAEPAPGSGVPDKEYIKTCQTYWMASSSNVQRTITNWDHPEVIHSYTLPDSYYEIGEGTEKNTEAVLVRFTTSEDATLGPVDMYLDEQGNLLGMGLRE